MKQVTRSLYKVVQLIFSCRLNNNSIIQVLQVVIETENIHSSWIKLVRFIAFIFKLLINITLMFSILKKSVLIVFKISFILTIINNIITWLIQLFQIMIVECLVSLGLHFLNKHFSLRSNINIHIIGTFCSQRLQQSRSMVLSLSYISFLYLTNNEYLLSRVKVLDFA